MSVGEALFWQGFMRGKGHARFILLEARYPTANLHGIVPPRALGTREGIAERIANMADDEFSGHRQRQAFFHTESGPLIHSPLTPLPPVPAGP